MKSEHIKVGRVTDGVEVVADDCELFDDLDDILTERWFETDYTREENATGHATTSCILGRGCLTKMSPRS